MIFMQKQLPCTYAITVWQCYSTNFGISNKKITPYDTIQNSKGTLFTLFLTSLSALLIQNIEFLFSVNIPNLSLTEEKFESCIQNKHCKPQNQVEFFSTTCFFKTMIISDMKDFFKNISCSETTHVSTKQRLPGFHLTLQKWFVRFPNANNRKRYLNCRPPWWGDKENLALQIA